MSSRSESYSGSSTRYRNSSRDLLMKKLRCLEEEIRRSHSRYRRSRSRHRDKRSRPRHQDERSSSGRYSRRFESWGSDKENGERIAVENRRSSHSRHERSYPGSSSRSINYDSDGKSGERHLRDASHSSRERSVAAVQGLDKEGGERNPRDSSRPSPHTEMSVKQAEDQEKQLSTELAEATLGLLGDDPSKYNQRGPDIHVAVAERWTKILQDGLPIDQKRVLLGKYPTIGNCPLTKAPKVQPEIKSA
ncbi:arginine/serine-rich coiled-coil protein 2-like [Neodiprion pinetum]|uniref:arginine/serine-rich coiled-coil protein 2-like n=1 Tax=Neodiprion pinetum TaxID=441929 RepID=UPI00371C7F8C